MSDEARGVRRTWTNIYLQFSLTAAERRRLDEYLGAHNVTLGMRLRQALNECLRQAGIEPP